MGARRLGLGADDFAKASPFSFVVDGDGRMTVVGETLRRRLGAETGQHVDEAFRVVRPPRVKSFLDLAVDPTATVLLCAADGILELKGSTMALDGGGSTAFLGSAVVRDIAEFRDRGLQLSDFPPSDATPDLLLSMQATRTGLEDARKLSAELKQALVEAQSATEAKARFLAVMSHEIRTPLNGFGSMIDLLRDGTLTDEQIDNLNTMDHCTQSLLALVNDILDFSKLEAGRVEIVRSPTDAHAAFTVIVEHFRATARERGTALSLDVDLPQGTWIKIDFERVRQIVANLVGNALKFAAAGAVRVRVDAPADGRIGVDVVDNGIGISEADRERLFAPFVQADASKTRRYGGTGLGLTISQQLARAMGGEVQLLRSDATGTHFRFEFEAERAAPPAPATAAPNGQTDRDKLRFDGASVLIAEDDQTNQLIATKMLRKLGAEPTVVSDGREAIEAANGRRFDLILMDVMMPNLNGIDAAAQIRAGGGPCSDVPIVAFSAAAFGDDRSAATAAGMSGFLEKPARLATLLGVLEEHLGADR